MDFTSAWHPDFQYKTEFQSHKPEVCMLWILYLKAVPKMGFMLVFEYINAYVCVPCVHLFP